MEKSHLINKLSRINELLITRKRWQHGATTLYTDEATILTSSNELTKLIEQLGE